MMWSRISAVVRMIFIVGVLRLPSALAETTSQPYRVVCYLGSWANYRYGYGKFLIEDIDPFICTHLIYGFAKLGPDNRIASYDPYMDLEENWGLGGYKRFNELKNRNPELTTILAIGGWNEGSIKYSSMASSHSTRKVFVESCVHFLMENGFDGLDMDWEYPANRGGGAEDKQNFILLLKELKEAFRPFGLLLTAAVSAGRTTIDTAYDIPSMSKYLDFINVMTYDFHGAWDSVTGHNAPLFPRADESETDQMLNADYAIRYWLKRGAPPEKLVLGMALYGRTFTLYDPNINGLGAPAVGQGVEGPYTQEPGMIGFNELCSKMQQEGDWAVVFDPEHKVPFAFKGSQWVGYDDIESIAYKVEYIKKMNLSGGMVWSIETDDFRGHCEGFRYPLLTTIHRGLNGPPLPFTVPPPSDDPTRRQSPSTTPRTTTEVAVISCTQRGYFRHPKDCKRFYLCLPTTSGRFELYMYTCAPGTVFSEPDQTCTFPEQVPECRGG